jgi:hypothetical protein
MPRPKSGRRFRSSALSRLGDGAWRLPSWDGCSSSFLQAGEAVALCNCFVGRDGQVLARRTYIQGADLSGSTPSLLASWQPPPDKSVRTL